MEAEEVDDDDESFEDINEDGDMVYVRMPNPLCDRLERYGGSNIQSTYGENLFCSLTEVNFSRVLVVQRRVYTEVHTNW